MVWSSVIVASVGATAVSTGASLTAVTVIDAVSVARAEGGRAAVRARVGHAAGRAAGLVPGAVGERAGGAVLAVGHEADQSVARSSSAALSETAPTAVQVAPPLIEYCQVPLPVSAPVIAMPCSAPVSTSVIEAPMNDATVWPAFAVWSSVIDVSVGAIGADTGASLTAATVIDAV